MALRRSRIPMLLLLIQIQGCTCSVTTLESTAVLAGHSLTLPCHYNQQYVHHVKYWCQGRLREICSSLARSDDPKSAPGAGGRVSIADVPSQHVFTVTMEDLEEKDSGWYWCGVEVGGMWSADAAASIYIDVIHGMSVVNSMVHGEEGGSVDIQCLYSKKYRNSVKRWCRSGDWSSCVSDSNSSHNSQSALSSSSSSQSVVSDDGRGMLAVRMSRLRGADAGWYWCIAGEQQVSVHVSVTPRPLTTTDLTTHVVTTPHSPTAAESHSRRVWESPLLACSAILLLVSALVVPWRIWQHCKQKQKQRQDRNLMVCPLKGGAWKDTPSVIFLNSSAQQVHLL